MALENFSENVGYEIFAQEIYQALLNSENIKPIKVQHNINLPGRSGCLHQIDVYWEYELAGIVHKVAVECKNFNTSNVSIGKIRDFYAALMDIGNTNGIFVCKNGYQSGAIKFADYYGINLKELRFPIEDDWKGRVKTIEVQITSIYPYIKSRKINFDLEWFKLNYPSYTGKMQKEITGVNNQILIKDKNGNKISDFLELENKLPNNNIAERDIYHEYKFEDGYVEVDSIGAMKLSSIEFVYDISTPDPKIIILSGEEITKAILKDIKTGDIKFFNKDGAIK